MAIGGTIDGALDVATTQTASLITMGILVLLAVAAFLLLTKIFVKLVVIAVIVVVGIAVYSQRAELSDCPRTCSCSFFGYELEIPNDTVNDACQDVVSWAREVG